jgi:flagellar assembly protein FliH
MTSFDPIDIRHFRPAPPDGKEGAARAAPRILFEEDFTPPRLASDAARRPPESAPEPIVVAPSFSEAELEEARRAAFREGKDAGRTAARAEAEAAGQAALSAIAAALERTAQAADAAIAESAEGAVRLVLGMLAALHPSLSRALAEADIAAMLSMLLPQLSAEPRLSLRLCPPLAEKLAPRLRELADAAGFQGEISVRPDPAIAPDGATLSWSAGAALRDPPSLHQALLDSLGPLGLSPLTPPLAPEPQDHVHRTA